MSIFKRSVVQNPKFKRAARGEFDTNFLQNTAKDVAAFGAGGAAFGGGPVGGAIGAASGLGWNIAQTLYWRYLTSATQQTTVLAEDVNHFLQSAASDLRQLNPTLSTEIQNIGQEFQEAVETVLNTKAGIDLKEMGAGLVGANAAEKAVKTTGWGSVAGEAGAAATVGSKLLAGAGSLGVGLAVNMGIDALYNLLKNPHSYIAEAADSVRRMKDIVDSMPQKDQLTAIYNQATQELQKLDQQVQSMSQDVQQAASQIQAAGQPQAILN